MIGKLKAAFTYIRVTMDELSYRAQSNTDTVAATQDAKVKMMRERMERATEEGKGETEECGRRWRS